MKHSTSTDKRAESKNPNFGLVVLLAGVAFIVVFLCAFLVLKKEGRKLLPRKYNPHPTSYMVPTEPQSMDA
ncbi:MAG TPA: hypothetical protein VHW70_10935 [Edaphobacter sp.]|jgi:hypothetical protein|nr:hypothetical protein [Edaphobacter sp.]